MYQDECDPVGLMLITVDRDATLGVMPSSISSYAQNQCIPKRESSTQLIVTPQPPLMP
jgi:hypothetical protein